MPEVPEASNRAVTVVSDVSVMSHSVAVPVHNVEDQPPNVDPDDGLAVNTNCVPAGNWPEQLPGHEMPRPGEVTVPLPTPVSLTVSVAIF